MANPEHVATLEQGVEAWNAWRSQNPDISPDLREASLTLVRLDFADLRGVKLCKANLFEARLHGANLRGANLDDANLAWPDLSEADLGDASLRGASLSGANLSNANLSGANLFGAQFNHDVDLRGADLTKTRLISTFFLKPRLDKVRVNGAQLGMATFSNVGFQGVIGLEMVRHDRPSTIGIDTILSSGGQIPDAFLRGCGVNPLFQRILVGDRASMTDAFHEWINEGSGPLRLQSCFISYSTRDKPFVDRLQKSLNASGVNYWYAPEHGRWGQDLTIQIDREIENRDRVILVCSEHSLASDWVQWEIDRTREQEKARGKTILYPVMLDDAVLSWNDPRALRIREILVGDFRGATKGKAFEERFGRLMEGLRDEG